MYAAQRRHPSEPRADADRHPGLCAWRPVRQHCARLQLCCCHKDGAASCRHCGHGSRIRRGSGRGEVCGHQVPHVRPDAERRGAGGDRPCAQEPRWRCQG
ncbi:hypothetical protein EVA_20104 [gut metagenome]|uniref:Uncharacterized protein n=1 Tax=gut metagenome TaxID=749906 RepID=J9FWQ7_9ZZZZ